MSYPTINADAASIVTLYPTSGPHPNGLQATAQGLWCIDDCDADVHIICRVPVPAIA